MKRVEFETSIMYIGTAREMCSLRRKLIIHDIAEVFHCEAKFNMNKMYGLEVDFDDEDDKYYLQGGNMYILTADTVIERLLDENAIKSLY